MPRVPKKYTECREYLTKNGMTVKGRYSSKKKKKSPEKTPKKKKKSPEKTPKKKKKSPEKTPKDTDKFIIKIFNVEHNSIIEIVKKLTNVKTNDTILSDSDLKKRVRTEYDELVKIFRADKYNSSGILEYIKLCKKVVFNNSKSDRYKSGGRYTNDYVVETEENIKNFKESEYIIPLISAVKYIEISTVLEKYDNKGDINSLIFIINKTESDKDYVNLLKKSKVLYSRLKELVSRDGMVDEMFDNIIPERRKKFQSVLNKFLKI